MSKEPKGDHTNLGNILLSWSVITEPDLEKALEQQKTLRGDALLGKLLVANGSCTEDEIKAAMKAQTGMRSVSKSKQAMAVADIAIERRRRGSVFNRRVRLEKKAIQLEKNITGNAHPVISAAMLAKPDQTG